jgi:hypothetical protein
LQPDLLRIPAPTFGFPGDAASGSHAQEALLLHMSCQPTHEHRSLAQHIDHSLVESRVWKC